MDRRDAIKHTSLLMGGLLSASTIAGIMAGCSGSNDPDWEPQFLSKDQARMVEDLTVVLIPATDTPGAKEAGVPQFIDTMLAKYQEEDEKTLFIAGLEQVNQDSQAAYSKNFVDLTQEQQTEILTAIAEEAVGEQNTFFHQLKGLTFSGYFTSELVGKEVLNFDPVPSTYNPCMPIEEVNNVSWTL